MLKITDYEIVRGVKAGSKYPVALPRGGAEPIGLLTLLNEQKFLENQWVLHGKSVFIEDHMHDWNVHNGKLYYCSRTCDVADVVLVYAQQEIEPPMNFCPMTGKRLIPE